MESTGAGQIVSVTDTGLDINHKYFGPTSDEVFRVRANILSFVSLSLCFDIDY